MNASVIYHSATGNTQKMADLITESLNKSGVNARAMSVHGLDIGFIQSSSAVLFGCPTYFGNMSWQMKQCIDTITVDLNGKLGAVFASAHWPGGGGYELTEMNLIAAMLIKGMMIYSGGVVTGMPVTHFGAVSNRDPQGFDAERCVKLGINIANKLKELDRSN